MEKYPVLRPTYFKDFKCIGSDCKINCCSYGWNIVLDKNTYLKYKSIKEPKYLSNLINNCIIKNKDTYLIKHKNKKETFNLEIYEDGKYENKDIEFLHSICPFEDEKGLCCIQKEMGSNYLSDTCKIFPRINKFIISNYELSLGTGCEAVCELLYNIKDGIDFELVEDYNYSHIDFKLKYNENNKLINYFDDIRLICIQLLQLKDISMDNKMILLSILMNKINDLNTQQKFSDIEIYLNSFFDNIDIYSSLFDNIDINQGIFFDIFKSLIVKNIYSHKEVFLTSSDIISKFNKLYEELDSTEDRFCKTYLEYKEKFNYLVKEKEYFIENVFINLFFTQGYPFNDKYSIKDYLIIFIFNYIIYKGVLTIYFSDKESIEKDELIKITTIFSRIYMYQNNYDLLKEFKKQKLDTLAHLINLIQNS